MLFWLIFPFYTLIIAKTYKKLGDDISVNT